MDLHDHPSMIVTSKVLKGEILRYSMDKLHPMIQEGIFQNSKQKTNQNILNDSPDE